MFGRFGEAVVSQHPIICESWDYRQCAGNHEATVGSYVPMGYEQSRAHSVGKLLQQFHQRGVVSEWGLRVHIIARDKEKKKTGALKGISP